MVISQSKSIQKKLLAATAMLLVACIMLISASYAWFTLSTAPEITGITTTIGANGNLEIALADKTTWADPDRLVQTSMSGNLGATGLQGNAVKNINITWGNLIDVSQYYGLEGVTLLPSRLNLHNGNINSAPLSRPTYGTDGRVTELVGDTDYAIYKGNNLYEIGDDQGVRVIGSASGMTERQLAYRSAKIALANAIADAKAAAKISLESKGTELANIVMQKAVNAAPTYSQADVTTIIAVLDGLTTAQQHMLKAWEAAVVSYAASEAGKGIAGLTTDEAYNAFKDKMQGAEGVEKEYTVNVQEKTVTANGVTVTLPGDFAAYYEKISLIAANIGTAKQKAEALQTAQTIEWTNLNEALSYIVDYSKVTVNGLSSSELRANLSRLISSVASGKGIQVEMPTGAGVYADIADFCGNYQANVELKNIKYGDLELGTDAEPIKATMTTMSSVNPSYFSVASSVVTTALAPTGSGASNNKVTELYGYVIDYYMRTNAANANLMLQVEGAQRVYADGTNEATKGGGSYMTFTTNVSGYTTTQMKDLMKAIRVVFTTPGENGQAQILAVATLDIANADSAGNTVKAALKLCEYTTDGNVLKIVDANPATDAFDFKESQAITALTQNQAMKVSTMVYLDGDYVTNGMVANAAQSMTGKMNLQFATDTPLVPMEDTALRGDR